MSTGIPELLLLSASSASAAIAAVFAILCFLKTKTPILGPDQGNRRAILRSETEIVNTAVQGQSPMAPAGDTANR